MYFTKILMTTICLFSLEQVNFLSTVGNPEGNNASLQIRSLTAKIGFNPDSDGDGVPNQTDRCPDTPAGVAVGANGCPIQGGGGGTSADLDGDGVPNQFDICSNTPQGAFVDSFGCLLVDGGGTPDDLDGDGVHNDDDECPNTPPEAIVHANGCPID